jgi:hypothetical protein
MARWHVRAVAVAALAFGTSAAAQPAGDVRGFNGAWEVTLVCPLWKGALGYTVVFLATVSDGHLHGQFGQQNQPDSLTYEGTIHPDGCASIIANGVTGPPKFNIDQVPEGHAYGYHVTAQFEGSHGHGKRTEVRPCDVDFVRQ